jgi:hypothetical protein
MLRQGGRSADHSNTRWGLNSTEWDYLKKELSEEFRLIVWDLPGLGRSTPSTNRDYSLENLSRHLEAVLALVGDQPAILLVYRLLNSFNNWDWWPLPKLCVFC